MKTQAWWVISGAGALGLTEAAAMETIVEAADGVGVLGAGGASAGSINAAALAFGIGSPTKIWTEILSSGVLMDWKDDLPGNLGEIEYPVHAMGILKGPGHGLIYGREIKKAIRKHLGDARMGDAPVPLRIVVGSLYHKRNVVIDSEKEEHKHLLVANVTTCSSAVPLMIDAQQIDDADPELFADGGTANNVPAALFDDKPEPTLVMRFAPPLPTRDTSLWLHLRAIFALARSGAEDERSQKGGSRDIVLPELGDALDFAPSSGTIAALDAGGRGAAMRWLAAGGMS